MSDEMIKLDAVTKTWTNGTAGKLIEHYLTQNGSRGGDALFLIELSEWKQTVRKCDEEDRERLRRFAFFLKQFFKRTDVVMRIGEYVFGVYVLGCRNRKQIHDKICDMRIKTPEKLTVGAVLCCGTEKTCKGLLEKAGSALYKAASDPSGIVCVTDGEEAADTNGWCITPIPETEKIEGKADMEFSGMIMEYFMEEVRPEDEMIQGLKLIGRYFDVGLVYIAMKSQDDRNYEVAYEWESRARAVDCNNLRTLSGILGDRYGLMFDSKAMMICSRLEELECLAPVMAERQRLLGTKSLMQHAVLQSGKFIGYLCLADVSRERMWSQKEIATFSMVGKAVSSCILQIRFENLLKRLMGQDMLTESWNYNQFLKMGRQCLHKTVLKQAVATLDIKNFKGINLQFGYETGNQVLVELSSLLHYFTGDDERCARIEADKFVLLLEYQSLNGLRHRLDQLIRRVERISADKKYEFPISCMIGVCLVRAGEQDMALLVDHANLARKSLKDFHKSAYGFYNEEAEKKIVRERELTLQLKEALKREEFLVYYQPKISLAEKKCIGMEALVRWKMKDGPLVPPDDFIPLCEKNGFITELDLYVFRKVCDQLAEWIREGKKVFPIAVNISRIHIKEPDFLEVLDAVRSRTGVPAEYLELEITESAFLYDSGIILKVSEQIKERGFTLSMDDFGTGYSSLSLLKDLPVDIIKLDREFFKKEMSGREKIIVSNVINMAKQLNIQVVSEGIETKENELFLEEIGCEFAQGYRYGRPVPIEELGDWLR